MMKSPLLYIEQGFFDEVFESRQRGDYKPMVSFEREQVKEILEQAEHFLKEMENLIK